MHSHAVLLFLSCLWVRFVTPEYHKEFRLAGTIPSSFPTVFVGDPTIIPTRIPTVSPTPVPTKNPSRMPSQIPSHIPTVQPTFAPTLSPSVVPTQLPTVIPSCAPTQSPTCIPSIAPTYIPSEIPSAVPTVAPTIIPTAVPSKTPTRTPTEAPTTMPSAIPTYSPTELPTAVPTVMPSHIPTEFPTAVPTFVPTAVPTAIPTCMPTAEPTAIPTFVPTDGPTAVPTCVPTEIPTAIPTYMPTAIPTAVPTFIPTAIPTAVPTHIPTYLPTYYPTSQPSSSPSTFPSSIPTSYPSDYPSDSPTERPSSSPSSSPSSQPSSSPTVRPSSIPTSQPSSQPSSQPTSIPSTSRPTSRPSTMPTVPPTSRPTARPSSSPSSKPTSQPSSVPSSLPSSQPTSSPSRYPTEVPTCQPSSSPTNQPQSFPTTFPSSQPSTFPSVQPTSIPSGSPTKQPSTQPTAVPTNFESDRVFICGKQLACQSNSFTNCSFFTGNITIKCVPLQACLFQVGSFSVGPNTHIVVEGGCELNVIATESISIFNGSSIKGPYLSFKAARQIFIDGALITDSLGAEIGAGSPSETNIGIGGSYGGNGGQPVCENSTLTSSYRQIGSVRVFPDFVYQYDAINPAIGSGGGPGSFGGGIVVLNGNASVLLSERGRISCRGSSASSPFTGGGSGGSVVIYTNNFTSQGVVIVNGGNTAFTTSGAGGGGRVSLVISNSRPLTQHELSNIFVDGGIYESSSNNVLVPNRCLYGAPGTLYVQYTYIAVTEPALSATITIRNSRGRNYQPFAGTVLSNLPSSIGRVFVTGYSTLITKSLKLLQNANCKRSGSIATLCSSILITNSTMICANVTSVNDAPEQNSTCYFRSDNMVLVNSKLESSPNITGNIYCKNFTLLPTSSIELASSLSINSTDIVHLYGPVKQKAQNLNSNVSFTVLASVNISIFSISADSVYMKASNIYGSGASIVATSSSINPTYSFLFNQSYCQSSNYIPNSITLDAAKLLKLSLSSTLYASSMLLCAHDLHIFQDSALSTNGAGALVNSGYGMGLTIPSAGSGGGGFGGAGGTGQSPNLNGGSTYGSQFVSMYGSGGGCDNTNLGSTPCVRGGSGGGIINIRATNILLYGNITANGVNGIANAGGGSGGFISMEFESITGDGNILALGGNGGSGTNPGGGGGGGFVSLNTYTAIRVSNVLAFEGFISSGGGLPGTVQVLGVQSGVFSAAAGVSGIIELPDCDPGFGNSASQGRICVPCDIGYYSVGGDGSCLVCSNKPPHAFYIQSTWYNANCPYQCENGYTTDSCYDPFQEFLYDKIGLSGFIGSCVGFFALILIPLAYYRYKKYNDWGDKEKRNLDIFGKAFFYDTYDDGMGGKSRRRGTQQDQHAVSIDSMFSNENPMFHHTTNKNTEYDENGDAKWMRIRPITQKAGKDGRREIRIVDQDMIFHAYRINLMGSNEPLFTRGGAWRLPHRRPDCLKPTLLASEYYNFAKEINKMMEWKLFSVEMLSYYLVLLLTPPISSYYMRQLRHRRTQRLLRFISSYDHACFRCPIQRRLRNSLRVGISPDSTLAYIDILFDESHFTKSCKPLCPLGQTKLPAAFKFAGLGTYSTPYYIDTNDLLLQAVSQTDVANAFIDEAWVSFVYNMNIHLRTLQCDAIYLGVRSLMKFLAKTNKTKDLGGLQVQFCTFENETYDEEEEDKIESAKAAKAQRRKTVQQAAEDNTVVSVAESKGDDQRVRESFADMARPSRASRDNWFHHVGDMLHIHPVVSSQKAVDKADTRESLEGQITMSEIGSGPPTVLDVVPKGASSGKAKSEPVNQSSSTTNTTGDMPIRAPTPPPDTIFMTIGGCFSWIYTSLLSCCLCFLPSFLKKPVATQKKRKERSGKPLQSMDFIETCEAIRSGRLSMGVVIYHPKVISDTYIIQSEDYASDLEDDDVLDETMLGDGLDNSDEESINNTNAKEGRAGSFDSIEDELNSTRRVNFGATTTSASSNVELSMGGSSLLRSYGNKADEMAKFYKIMMEAESGEIAPPGNAAGANFTPGSSMSASMKFASFSEKPLSPSVFPFPMTDSRNSSFSGNPRLKAPITSPTTAFKSFDHQSSEKRSPDRANNKVMTTATPTNDSGGYTEFSTNRGRAKSTGFTSTSFADDEDTEVEDRPKVGDDNGYETEDKSSTNAMKARAKAVRSYSVFNPRGSFDSNEDDEGSAEGSRQNSEGGSRYSDENQGEGSRDNSDEKRRNRAKSNRISRRLMKDVGNDFSLTASDLGATVETADTIDDESRTAGRSMDENSSYHQRYSEVSENQNGRDTFASDSGHGFGRSNKFDRKNSMKGLSHSTKPAVKTAEDLEAVHLAELRALRRKRRLQAITLTKRENLAPSCYQHSIRAWVYSNSKLEGAFCSGKLGHADSIEGSLNAVAIQKDEEMGLSRSDNNAPSKLDDTKNSSRATFDISSNADDEDDTTRRSSSVGSSRKKRKEKKSSKKAITDDPLGTETSERFRDSILPASFFSRMTFSGRGTQSNLDEDEDEEQGTSDRQSLAVSGKGNNPLSALNLFGSYGNNNAVKADADTKGKTAKGKKPKGMTADEAITSQSSRRKQSIPNSTTNNDSEMRGEDFNPPTQTFWTDLFESIRGRLRLAYINNFYIFFFTRFMVGYNIFPYGPSYVRRLIEIPLFLLSLSDCILWVLILSTSLCVSNDVTKCENHLAFNLMISLWPGAFILAPISGMIAIVLGPSPTLARIYAMFSRLASLNNLVLIVVVIKYSAYYLSIDQFSIWPVVALTSGRLFQTFMVDLYIAHIEKLRYTRGWDGLHTSLFKTRDNKVLING